MPGAVDLDDLDRHVACSLLLLLLRHGCARALGPRRPRGAGGLLVAGLAHLLVVGAVPVVGLLALAARLDAHAALVRAGLLVARHRAQAAQNAAPPRVDKPKPCSPIADKPKPCSL